MADKQYDFSNGSSNPYKVEPRHHMIPKCMHCGEESVVILDGSDYFRFFVRQVDHVQNIFYYLTPEQREVLLTGTHPECWDSLIGNPDEEEF